MPGIQGNERPVSTYSIVARDESGSIGVAVQSHWFSVGSIVPWVEAGIGGVAIQSFPNPTHGPRALELLKKGTDPAEILAQLLDGDDEAAFRQISMVDANGTVATHTGESCIPEAGHQLGDGFSAQANLMDKNTVWGAMARAFEQAEGDLAERLLQALEAAEGEGGDIRGRQSAAIVVVTGEPSGISTEDRIFDLRVEDHPDPLGELRRLVQLRRAYIKLNEGDDLVAKDDLEAALDAYRAATEMIPDAATGGEAAFWTGITLAGAGRSEEAAAYVARAQEQWPGWVRLIQRLTSSGILPNDQGLIDSLVLAARSAVD